MNSNVQDDGLKILTSEDSGLYRSERFRHATLVMDDFGVSPDNALTTCFDLERNATTSMHLNEANLPWTPRRATKFVEHPSFVEVMCAFTFRVKDGVDYNMFVLDMWLLLDNLDRLATAEGQSLVCAAFAHYNRMLAEIDLAVEIYRPYYFGKGRSGIASPWPVVQAAMRRAVVHAYELYEALAAIKEKLEYHRRL